MKYYLAFNTNKSLIRIDLSGIIKSKSDRYSLSFLDKFTMKFNNEFELKSYLLEKGLIKEEHFNNKLFISYGNKNKRESSIFYSSDEQIIKKIKKFSKDIMNYLNIRNETYYSDNDSFEVGDDYKNIITYLPVLEKFAKNERLLYALQKYVYKNPSQRDSVNEILDYIDNYDTNKSKKKLYVYLFKLFKKMFYFYKESTQTYEFNYKEFRDFCEFYLNFKFIIRSEKEVEETKKNIYFEEEENRKLKLSSDGDPDFPYNSEEERKYLEYIESLPSEEPDIKLPYKR